MANDTGKQATDAASDATKTAADTAQRTTRDAADATKRMADDASAASGQMADQMRGAAERMQAAGGAISDSGQQVGMKMLEQAEANTNEAFKAMRAAAKANDLSEVMRIQSEYMRDQSSRSMTQAREIGELIASFGKTAMGRMTGRD